MPSHDSWLAALQNRLADRHAHSLLRTLQPLDSPSNPEITISGKTLLQFSTNNYLGLATDPEVVDAARDAAARWGAGAGASRLVAGSLAIHHELETALAQFKHSESALLFPTGFMANLAVLTTFATQHDAIVSDKLNHASLLDAARFAGSHARTFPHLNYARAETLLAKESAAPTRFLVSDSVFSMDGDLANLPALCDAAESTNSLTVIDEAHATGILGPTGSGLAEAQNVQHRIDISVGTLSKAFGSLGGFVTAPKPVIDTLINSARPFIYTTALPPSCAAAALAALRIIQRDPARRLRVLALADHVRTQLRAFGYNTAHSATPIIPIILGDSAKTLAASQLLRSHGIFIPPIRPPTVPPNSTRLRLSLMATHTDAQITRLLETLRTLAPTLLATP